MKVFTPAVGKEKRMFRRKGRDLRNVAALAVHKGKYDKALGCYLSLEKHEPGEAEWSRRVAQMYERLGKKPEAIAALERTAVKYRRAGFEAKASAVNALIHRLDPERGAAAESTDAPADAPADAPSSGPRKRRRLAAGTERLPPPAVGVKIAWAYHPEISKDERVTLALADLSPDESEPSAETSTESGARRKR